MSLKPLPLPLPRSFAASAAVAAAAAAAADAADAAFAFACFSFLLILQAPLCSGPGLGLARVAAVRLPASTHLERHAFLRFLTAPAARVYLRVLLLAFVLRRRHGCV